MGRCSMWILVWASMVVACAPAARDNTSVPPPSRPRPPSPAPLPSASAAPSTPDEASAPVRLLDCANHHCCLVRGDHRVECWGLNRYGVLGDGSTNDSERPVLVPGTRSDARIEQIALGEERSYVRYDDGQMMSWGAKRGPYERASAVAVRVMGYDDVRNMAVGSSTCVQTALDNWECWSDFAGATMLGTMDTWFSPRTMPAKGAKQMSVGYAHACFRGADDKARCWGENSHDELGDTRPDGIVATPVEVVGLPPIQEVRVGEQHSCAVLLDGRVACWGFKPPCGDHDKEGRVAYVRGLPPAQAIAAGRSNCVLANDGTVHCWGDCPKCCAGAPAIGMPPAKAIVGRRITCALSRDGEVFCLQRSPGQKREDGTVVKAYEFERVDSR